MSQVVVNFEKAARYSVLWSAVSALLTSAKRAAPGRIRGTEDISQTTLTSGNDLMAHAHNTKSDRTCASRASIHRNRRRHPFCGLVAGESTSELSLSCGRPIMRRHNRRARQEHAENLCSLNDFEYELEDSSRQTSTDSASSSCLRKSSL